MATNLARVLDDQIRRRGRPTSDMAKAKGANLLAVAQSQFAQNGYRAVTMRNVAEQAEVSTRTLYNHYSDKLSLFKACLEMGSISFPAPEKREGETLGDALQRYAISLVGFLSEETSRKLGLLVYRDGAEFPDMVAAAEANQDKHLVKPLARFFEKNAFPLSDAETLAKLFIAMAIADWTRRITFGHAMPDIALIESHCSLATSIFMAGIIRTAQ